MFCTKCGQKLNDGVSFCTNCGAPVQRPGVPDGRAAAPGPAPRTPEPQPVRPAETPRTPEPQPVRPVEAARPDPQYYQQPQKQRQPGPAHAARKKSSGTLGIIIGIVVAVLVLLAAAFFVLKHYDLLPFGGSDKDNETSQTQDDRLDGTEDDEDGDKDDSRPGDTSDQNGGQSGGEDEPEDPYPDTVDISEFIADPGSYSGTDMAVNATVEGIFRSTVTARLTSGRSGTNVYLDMSGVDTSGLEAGDSVYIDGVYRMTPYGVGYFEDADVTVTQGAFAGDVLTTSSAVPTVVCETVADYSGYSGAFSTSSTVDAFSSAGGPMVQLSVSGGEIQYAVSSASSYLDKVAQVTGTVSADGSGVIDFTGDDGWGGGAYGRIYLLAGGGVAVESSAPGSQDWGLDIPYTELGVCQGAVPVLFEPAGDWTQELTVVSSGNTAVVTLRNWDHGKWQDVLTVNAALGTNGVKTDKTEGDRATPGGTFRILFAMGTASRTLSIPYYQVKAGDVWVDDANSAFYNTMQTTSTPGKDWKSAEDLYNKFTKNHSVACIYFDYNGDGLTAGSARYNGGSDLFVDGLGVGASVVPGYGDIRISSTDMEALLPLLDSARNPRIVIS